MIFGAIFQYFNDFTSSGCTTDVRTKPFSNPEQFRIILKNVSLEWLRNGKVSFGIQILAVV